MNEALGTGVIVTAIATVLWALIRFLIKDWYEKTKEITRMQIRESESAIAVIEREVNSLKVTLRHLDKNLGEMRTKITAHSIKIDEHKAAFQENTKEQKENVRQWMRLVSERFKLIEDKTEKIRLGVDAFLHHTKKGNGTKDGE